MPGLSGIKRIAAKLLLTRGQRERRFLDDQVLVAGHAANAAVAVMKFELSGSHDFKSHPTAMAASFMNGHRNCPSPVFSQATSILFAGIA